MKPVAFQYQRPASVAEALALLAQHGDEAKVLAGGQSLVPAMNFRLAQPAVLVDINRVSELDYINSGPDGGLVIGARTRQRGLELSPLVAAQAPLLAEAVPWIAHVQIRNRGTVGGSVAHADPAAELPALMLALDGKMRVRGPNRSPEGDWIAAADFFTGLLETALAPEDLLVEISLPPLAERTGCAFVELSRRRGDYALVGVAATLTLDPAGTVAQARLALFGVGEGPTLAAQAMAALVGQPPRPDAIAAAAALAGSRDIEPASDVHASSAYRRHLATVLTTRALTQAVARAHAAGPAAA